MRFPLLFALISAQWMFIENVEITTPLGRLLGSTLTTRLGKTIFSFRGIRYAQAPVAELRFKPPVPITDAWSGIYNATKDGPICPQPSDGDPVSEDCLFLNVYTTKLPSYASNPKRPVIVFIHAGGFYSVTGRSDWGGPQYFMDQDIVLVTINYRLGTLGFLSMGKEAPGNNGLKDQVVALKWVKNNIAAFGGDPDCVTLFGYSAGATSITLHMVSPMSRGLFQRAILGSGSALGQLSLPNHQLEIAKKQARFVGCPDSSPTEILNCLKTKSAKELGNTLPRFSEFGRNDPVLIWSPVIEKNYGQERFLTDHPIKLIKEGRFEKIPVVAGITEEEFGYKAFNLVGNKTLLDALNENWEKYAPICFEYERGTEKSKEVSTTLRKFYLENEPLSNASVSGLAKLYADSIIGFSVNRAVDLLAECNSKSVYYYKFTYPGRFSHFYLPGTRRPYRVVHHDDLIYLFYISPLFPFFNQTYPETEMVETLTSLWANFAKTGKPVKQLNITNEVDWKEYNPTTRRYMDIGKKLILKANMFEERYALWRRLFPLSLYL